VGEGVTVAIETPLMSWVNGRAASGIRTTSGLGALDRGRCTRGWSMQGHASFGRRAGSRPWRGRRAGWFWCGARARLHADFLASRGVGAAGSARGRRGRERRLRARARGVGVGPGSSLG
jgi:hypothetical protein